MTLFRHKNSSFGDKNRSFKMWILLTSVAIFTIWFLIVTLPKVVLNVSAKVWNQEVNTKKAYAIINNFIFSNKASLIRQNQILNDKVNELSLKLSTQNILEKENETLRGVRADAVSDAKLFSVLSKPPISPYDTLIINGGIKDGIKVGDKALVGDIILGTVKDVEQTRSKVLLLSSPKEVLDVFIGEKKILVKAVGLGGGVFEFLIPKSLEVTNGDIISLPMWGRNAIGLVTKVESKDSSNSKGFFTLPINLNEISWVSIISGI